MCLIFLSLENKQHKVILKKVSSLLWGGWIYGCLCLCVGRFFFSFPTLSIYGKFYPVSLTNVQGESKIENRLKIAEWNFSKTGGPVMGSTPHLHFFPLAVSTCMPHRHLKLNISSSPYLMLPQQTCFSSVGLYLWGWPHYHPNYPGFTNQSSTTPYFPPNLTRLSNSVKSIFATFLKPNAFHFYCHDVTLGLYYLSLQWLCWFPMHINVVFKSLDSLDLCSFKFRFSHLTTYQLFRMNLLFSFLWFF